MLNLCQDVHVSGNQRSVRKLASFLKKSGAYRGTVGSIIDLQKSHDGNIEISSLPSPSKFKKKILGAQTKSIGVAMGDHFQYDLENNMFYIRPEHLNQPVTNMIFQKFFSPHPVWFPIPTNEPFSGVFKKSQNFFGVTMSSYT